MFSFGCGGYTGVMDGLCGGGGRGLYQWSGCWGGELYHLSFLNAKCYDFPRGRGCLITMSSSYCYVVILMFLFNR